LVRSGQVQDRAVTDYWFKQNVYSLEYVLQVLNTDAEYSSRN